MLPLVANALVGDGINSFNPEPSSMCVYAP